MGAAQIWEEGLAAGLLSSLAAVSASLTVPAWAPVLPP
jgi:hypothetical protein